MREIRIFAWVCPARQKPDLPFAFIHLLDRADHPVPFCDLVLHFACSAVIQIQVTPPVAFRHPDDLAAIVHVEAELLARIGQRAVGGAVGEERLRLFRDDRARGAGRRVDFDDAVHLVAALVVFEGQRPAVFAPFELGHRVGVREERVVDDDLLLRVEDEQHRLVDVEHIAGLRIEERRVFRLKLILRRRFDVVHFTFEAGMHLVNSDLFRIGRPHQRE